MTIQLKEQLKQDALSYIHKHSDLGINARVYNLGIDSNTLHGGVKKTKE